MSVHNSENIQKKISGSSAAEIAGSIERAIRSDAIAPDGRLPTVRACADALAVSPATVASAYRQLRERGLIVTRGRRGTRVSAQPPLPTSPAAKLPPGTLDLATGSPDPEQLPELGPALARLNPPRRVYGEALKDPELVALSKQQLKADGLPPGELTVVSGALDGIERVLLAHLRPGDPVAVEDPAFSGILTLLQPLGLIPVPVEIDESGLLPDALQEALRSGVQALILTPRAQNPTGAALDAKRARALKRVLRPHPDVLVIEDDHAGPVAGAPAHSICSGRARWAIARSFAKSLGPDLRVAILAGDAETVARVEGRQLIGMRWVSHVLQQLVVALLEDPDTPRLLGAAERAYTKKRTRLIDELAARDIRAMGRSGLNVWIPVPEEAAAIGGLLEAGFAVSGGGRFRLKTGPAIRVTTARLEARDAVRFADALARILAPSRLTLQS
jgi:DNA-binding transcriptional MocR family regulator